MKFYKNYFLFFYALSNLLFITNAEAAFYKSLNKKWVINNPTSVNTISHQKWQNFLDSAVTTNIEGINTVDYAGLTHEQHEKLDNYIDEMAKINIAEYNRTEQLAYWLNLYNALTVQTVMHYYPVTNIQDINISPGVFSVGPWDAYIITINNEKLTLNQIHNQIIRPIWNDPRTHYAINNATIGAPNLRKIAFTGENLNFELNQAAREYINSLRGVQIIDNKLVTSKIYDWFLEDFGEDEMDVITHLKYFADLKLRRKLTKTKRISSYMYNWHLNYTVTL